MRITVSVRLGANAAIELAVRGSLVTTRQLAFVAMLAFVTSAQVRSVYRTSIGCVFLLLTFLAASCRRSSAVSAERAKEHVALVERAIRSDLEEVRKGLPKGAEQVAEFFAAGKFDDAQASQDVLQRARSKVQDLRVAKSTFFALVEPAGGVIRSDQEHDALAGTRLFDAFPGLRAALQGKYVEDRGTLAEAAGVRGRKDGQWVAAQPVAVEGSVKGLYVTGWSWSAYAYRLENQLRSSVRSALAEREKEPLVYVYVVVGKDVFGAPVSPEVNARAVAERNPSAHTGPAPLSAELEITGRDFGFAYAATPDLGPGVGIAVLRSET